MTARLVKAKDALHPIALQRSGGKCEVAKRLQFGATDLHGNPEDAIRERCGRKMEAVYWSEDGNSTIAMCSECRHRVFGLTSGEKRKRTLARKDSQLFLQVRGDKDGVK